MSSSLSSEIAFQDDLDEEQEEDEVMLLACVLVGEYLLEKEERPTFYLVVRMEWESHISDLLQREVSHFNRCTEWNTVHF